MEQETSADRTTEEYLPCPFCGSKNIQSHLVLTRGYDHLFIIRCERCKAQTGLNKAVFDAASAWNERNT